jgi:hypothetical protein
MIRLLLIITLLISPAWAATWYVSTTGNDSTGTGSSGSPWATLSHACGQVSTFGDIISIAAGTYTNNSTCTLNLGVQIAGASAASVTVNTTANPYISAVSTVPTVNGSNVISGITFVGGGSNSGILSTGRNNQVIHDNVFTDFPESSGAPYALLVQGKAPTYVTTETTTTCNDSHPTATSTSPNARCTVAPASTDWATGVQVYNNTAANACFEMHTIKGALIHDNVIDNSANAGIRAMGRTLLFWDSVQFYNNTLKIYSNTVTDIAIEVWEISDDTKFYNNTIDGWSSLLQNSVGINTPYSYEFYDNDISSNITSVSGAQQGLETGYIISNVRIANNYFDNTGGNNTWTNAISVWGCDAISNYTIEGNVIYNMNGPGIVIDSALTSAFCTLYPGRISNINVLNNTFDDMAAGGSGGIRLQDGSGPTGTISAVTVRNNIFQNLTYAVKLNGGNSASGISGNFYDHNDINTATGHVDPGIASAFTIGSGDLAVSPGFTGSGARPAPFYGLAGGSGLIDVGANLGLPYNLGLNASSSFPWTTYDQNAMGTGWEIGAFVYYVTPNPNSPRPAAPSGLTAVVH